MRETAYDKATAVNDAITVVAEAIKASMGRTRNAEQRAYHITQALDEAGFQVRYRTLDLVDGYAAAVALTRGPVPSVAAVAEALGDASPDGPQGNVWALLDERYRAVQAGARIPTGFVPGTVATLPPGTELRAADAAAPERDDFGLRPWSADDLAARHGCRVEIAGIDDAHVPMSVEHGEGGHVVVTERATGRVVGLVEAWWDEDGDVLVPHAWLSTVLSAWDAARDPQRAA